MEQVKSFSGWSFDDIVFLGRNQEYGAYQLRKERAKNSLLGLLITVGIATVLIGSSFIDFSFLKSKAKDDTIETTVTLAEPPPLKDEAPPPPPPPPPPPVRPTVKFLEMVAKKDEEVQKDEPIIEQKQIHEEVAADTHAGDENAPVVAEPVITSAPIVEDKIFTVVEQMPAYPGGEEAMMKFIQANIQYPDMERENDIQGRVVVGFVVLEDGSLTDIAVKKGVSSGIDKEAVRVVKKLPKFTPGKQQGKAVKVSFVLPIMFKLASQ